jgi:tetratricopeptide (TPR) repeat protein
MRHAALVAELEACIGDNAVRVVLLTGSRGSGLSTALHSFAEEVRGWGHRADVVDAERVGVQAGGAVDALLRARLNIGPSLRGNALLEALDTASPDLEPLAREFLAFAMGVSREDFQTARLDPKSRWEGALAEVGRWLSARSGTWAWVLDDALATDEESLLLVERLARGAQTPGLLVLTVRDDERQSFEPRLKAIRASGKLRELVLPSLTPEALALAFPSTAPAARGVVLTAKLLQVHGREGGAPITTDALVRELVAGLPAPQKTLLSLLGVVGGRLPLMALGTVLGTAGQPSGAIADVVAALEAKLLLKRGATQRCEGADEVWLRFPSLAPHADAASSAQWLASVGAWAERLLWGETRNDALRAVALPHVIRASDAVNDHTRTSLAWELAARSGGGAPAWRKAEQGAQGVRRLVLARLLAEEELFRGDVQKAAATALAGSRLPISPNAAMSQMWHDSTLHGVADELERWDVLTVEEAQIALDLTRAEAISQLGQANETRRAFEAVEARLQKVRASAATGALWLRMAKTWVWFAAEILADGPLSRRICDTIRSRVPAEALQASFHASGFLRAEQVAHSRGGDPARARAMADELIELSATRGDPREECIAWNSRALLYLRDGDLRLARVGFERSLDLARAIGFRRREAVALHNLGLTQAYAGEFGASVACQERYVALSEQIGNFVARAYGPAALALVYVQQLDVQKAELNLARARRSAEENGWPGLIAWTRHLAGVLKLLKHLEKRDTLLLSLARSDFLASLDLLEDRKGGWSEELDPAEAAAFLSLTWLCAGNVAQANATLPRAEKFETGSAASKYVVQALRDLLGGRPPAQSVAWFEANGQGRAVELWQRIATALGLPVVSASPDVRSGL